MLITCRADAAIQDGDVAARERIFTQQNSVHHLLRNVNMHENCVLNNKSGVDKIIVKRQLYQLLNTHRKFFPRFHASNFYKLDD